MLKRLLIALSIVGLVGTATLGGAFALPNSQAPSADLAVSIADSPDPVLVGQNITYAITVTNNGPATATAATLTDALPSGVTFVSATSSVGSATFSSGTVTAALGDLANGASATVAIVVTATAAGSVSNTAAVTTTASDPAAANNSATATTSVFTSLDPADLSVTKTADPAAVKVGQNVTYTVTVKNNGPSNAAAVTLTDTLPANVAFVSVTASQGTASSSGGKVTASLGPLASGASATATIAVTPKKAGTLTNKAEVSATQPDPNAANNSATATTQVAQAAKLGKIEFSGIVQSMPSDGVVGTWKVQGLTVEVTDNTEVEGQPKVGSLVKVEGRLTEDGVVQAKEIEVKKQERREKHEDRDDKRPGFGFGDKNHEHEGPPGRNGHHHGHDGDDHGKGHHDDDDD